MYTFSGGNLATVSQIVASSVTSPPNRWAYGYTTFGTPAAPYLTALTSPDPTTPGATTTAYIDYYSTGAAAIVYDAGARLHYYAYGNPVQVQEFAQSNGAFETHSQKFSATKNVNTGITDAAGKSTTVAYSGTPSPYLPSAFTSRIPGQTTSVSYDLTDPLGGKYGNVGTTVDPRNVQTLLGYDYSTFALGQVTSVQESNLTTGATKQATTLSYYSNGLVYQVNTPAPDLTGSTTTTTYSYTSLGQPSQVVEPGNPTSPTMTTTYNYTTDSGTFIQNEALGEPITVTDNLGEVSHMRYDTQGNVLSMTDASGYTTQFAYNIADQCISVIYPATNTQGSGNAHTDTIYQYPGGPVQKVVVYDEAGSAVREVDYAYTHEGAVASITGSTQPTSYTYDERYRVISMADGNSHTTLYDYDPIGNLLDMKYPLASGQFDMTTYGYDIDQNLLTQIDGRGLVTTYTRNDPESLVTKVAYSAVSGVTPIQPVNYTYDDFGRRSGMNDGDGVSTGSYKYTYGYDDLDELLSQTVSFPSGPQNQTLSYLHNNDGSRYSLATPSNVSNPLTAINSGKFSYTYDGVGRLAQLNVPFTQSGFNGTAGDYLTHTYYPNGWLNQTNNLIMGTTTPDASTQAVYTYNPRGFLTKLVNSQYNGKNTIHALQTTSTFDNLTYDALGNRLTQNNTIPQSGSAPDASRQIMFSYDTGHSPAANRDVLTGETSGLYGSGSSAYNDVYGNLFSYDAAYNPTAFAMDGSALSYPVNLDNQISSTGFSYDGAGNPTSYQSSGSTLTFDPEDRLTGVPSASFTAQYDGDGLRIKKTDIGQTTWFLYDGSDPVVEEQMSGSTVSLFALNVMAADGWRARHYVGSQFYGFSFDPEGNVVSRQNSADTLYNAYATSSYEAYGNRSNDFSTASGSHPASHQDPARFGGQYGYYTDYSTGLLCLTHRYYDPGTGKFINRDPIGYAGGANLYGFADGNPVNEIDPNGTDALDALADGSYAAGGIISGGLTNRLDHWLGVDSGIDRSSTAYHVGTAIGYAHVAATTVVSGVGLVNGVRAIRAAGGIASAITALRGIGSLDALAQTYKLGSPASLKGVLAFNRAAYNDFIASDGKFQVMRDVPIEGGRVLGRYSAKGNIIQIGKGANLSTITEELVHFRQAQKWGIIGKGFDTSRRAEIEADAAKTMRSLGFVPK